MATPVYPPSQQELEVEFAEQFNQLQGKFIYCQDMGEFHQMWKSLLHMQKWERVYCIDEGLRSVLGESFSGTCIHPELSSCDASVTACEMLVARTGSIVLSAAASQGRTTSVYAPIHICVAFTRQLVYDVKDGLNQLKSKYAEKLPSLITFATGPSRTADIEKTLVVGVHGPKEVYCILIQS
jgi:L-lactate dehydrogenase complex protein LldG